MDRANQLVELFRKFLADDYTVAEFRQLQDYFSTDGHAELIKQLIRQAMREEADDVKDQEVDLLLEQVDARLSYKLFTTSSHSSPKRHWLLYAAAVVLIALLGVWAYMGDYLHLGSTENGQQFTQADVAPGTNRATLTLANGTIVALNEAQHGIVIGEELVYTDGSKVLAEGQSQTGGQVQLLSLSTPNGGTYQLTLQDSTTVWLNSSSTLSYPSHFDEGERVVHLTGEAYFAVNPQHGQTVRSQTTAPSIPFKVVTNGQTIHVLGTEFNVSAYPGKRQVTTTLVEGTVEIAAENTAATKRLAPGQQAIVQEGNVHVSDIDVRPFVSWKNGVFYFDRTPLADAMDALSRWYDVEVSYEGSIPRTHFYGEISRSKPLSEVLMVLKEGGVNFRIEPVEGRSKLIVSETDTKNKTNKKGGYR
ncbi:FecR family protein [Parapedobacter deserti]|uniref:FecR family protein n=1 Tax=Parapedobacter deserti TaxID=1912957 RepID=A0ABV7JMF7_9SPHI